MTENKPEPEVAVNPVAGQLLKNTESVVHQTFEDISGEGGVGDAVDKTKLETGEILKELKKLRREHNNFKQEVIEGIKNEVEVQVKPLANILERFVKAKPRFIWILPKLPAWLSWILRIKKEMKKNEQS